MCQRLPQATNVASVQGLGGVMRKTSAAGWLVVVGLAACAPQRQPTLGTSGTRVDAGSAVGDGEGPPVADALPADSTAKVDGGRGGSTREADVPSDGAPVCDPATCPAAPACQEAVCLAGGCTVVAAADGEACDDGNACTTVDHCVAGTCTGTEACKPAFVKGVGASPCQLTWSPPAASAIQLVPWLQGAGLNQPIALIAYPGPSNRVLVAERPGQIVLVANAAVTTPKKLALDLSGKISVNGEGGLLGVALHPQFPQQPKLYVHYTTKGVFTSIVSQFTLSATTPDTFDLGSEVVLLSVPQPFSNHNGGQIAFDVQGHLLVGLGDGGSAGDPLGAGQNGQTLLGKILRIDVNHAENGKNYAIPKDNPFVASKTVLPEIWALGMRNPWRFSVDPLTGQLWVGDVGQNKYEEIDIVEKGQNYGWNTMEGAHCYKPAVGCDTTGLALPVLELPHGEAKSITGGYVYRGKLFAGLYGRYVFGDYATKRFWAATSDSKGVWQAQLLLASNFSVASFGTDRDGELFALQLFPSAVARVEAVAPGGAAAVPPPKLSQTGCFASLQPLTPADGLLPYQLNAPLWSDGASKQRWIVLPAGATPQPGGVGPIDAGETDQDHWDLPQGSLVIKHFALGKTAVETRFMRREAAGWSMFTFRWLADGSDAELITGGGEQTFAFQDNGQAVTQVWHYPSQAECAQCHQGGTPRQQLLGPSRAQLDRAASATAGLNQLQAFSLAGLLHKPVDPAAVTAMPDVTALDSGQQPVSDVAGSARAYLHANCAHCHAPGLMPAQSAIDLRFGTPLAQMQACQMPPLLGDGGVAGAQLLAPGQPNQSVVWLRLSAPPGDAWQMPPLAVAKPHAAAQSLIAQWIQGLKGCTGP